MLLRPGKLVFKEESLTSEATLVLSERRSSEEPALLVFLLLGLRFRPKLPLLGGGSLVLLAGNGFALHESREFPWPVGLLGNTPLLAIRTLLLDANLCCATAGLTGLDVLRRGFPNPAFPLVFIMRF